MSRLTRSRCWSATRPAIRSAGAGAFRERRAPTRARRARAPAWRERSGPGDPLGWGVVFSDKTLSYLRDTDEETYTEITRSFATWDNVDVLHRDERVTIRGNKFSGIARLKLLNILQERCRALGVDLRFRAEVSNLDEFAGYDLIVGADGVNSTVRERFREAFQPSLGVRHNKHIWYGTHQLFHGLRLT